MVDGIVKAKAFVQSSDFNLKENIEDLENAIDILMKLEGKTFTWKKTDLDSVKGGRRVIGMIAQKVQEVLPGVVHQDKATGLLSIDYIQITPLLIEAFKSYQK